MLFNNRGEMERGKWWDVGKVVKGEGGSEASDGGGTGLACRGVPEFK